MKHGLPRRHLPRGLPCFCQSAPRHQISLDKPIDITVENAVRISYFEFCTMVFHQAVWMKHVRTYLVAKGDLPFGFFEFLGCLTPPLKFQRVEARAQELHSHFAIAVLRTLILALHDSSSRNVGDPNG